MSAQIPEPPEAIPESRSVVRHEEDLDLDTRTTQYGSVVLRKDVDVQRVEDVVPVGTERADVDRVAPVENDSGEIETLPDGTVSVPVFEEELVITKRLRVRERILIKKTTETRDEIVRGEVRTEHVEVVATGDVDVQDQK